MMSILDIQAYLPKYLSEENYRNLLKELDSFPNNIAKGCTQLPCLIM